ncbi:MAG: hypothetical protein EPN93_04580 [Spirochaetes bacterium]|nr:MAG: hypothetical protein EPN93_04580 [Spirochaetota bacterium]
MKRSIVGIILILLLTSYVHAEPEAGTKDYYADGWQISYSTLVVIVALNRDGTANKSIPGLPGSVKGTWEVTSGEALITWSDGWRDKIRADLANWAYAPGASLEKPPANKGVAKKDPKYFYTGGWDISYNIGLVNFMLNDDMTAIKSVPGVADIIKGHWEIKSGEVLITWDDGWRDRIRADLQNWAYAPGASMDQPPANRGKANRK